MGASTLSSRAIKGEFFSALESHLASHWVSYLSFPVESNQGSQDNVWLAAAPLLREWVANRQSLGVREDSVTIVNRKFEATIEVLVDEIRRDKTGQVMLRTRDLATRSTILWAQLITELVNQGETGIGYAGETFFNTAHTRGRTGLDADPQSNLLEYNVSSPTNPTGPEILEAITRGIMAILSFRDYEGEPINLDARHVDVFVPMSLASALRLGLVAPLCSGGYTVRIIPNPWLTWTDRIAVFRGDGTAKPFIRQQEFVSFAAVAAGSELEFNEEKHHYGVVTSRNAAYGLWEHACLVKLI
jgi:phage major head subunit gpT-like protein